MTRQSVNDFFQAIATDSALAMKVEAASEPSAVVQIGADNGYQFTEEELVRALSEQQLELPEKLSEEALEAVVGGRKKKYYYNN